MSRTRLAYFLVLLIAVGIVTAASAGVVTGDALVTITTDVDPDQPTTTEEFSLSVTISNSDSSTSPTAVDAVRVYDGPGEEAEKLAEEDNVIGMIGSGSERTVTVDEIEINETGVHDLRVETVLTRQGREHVVETSAPTQVYRPDPLVDVEAESAITDAQRPVNLTVANVLDEPISGVTVSVRSGQVSFHQSERIVSSIDALSDRTFSFDARPEESGIHDLAVTISYEDPNGEFREVERTVPTDFTEPSAPPEIRLTGISTEWSDGVLEISGSAANVGTDTSGAAVVSVQDAEGVDPTSPQPEFFVGDVEKGDFASFTVTAEVDDESTTVPLNVSYLADGVEITESVEVRTDASPSSTRQSPPTDESGGFPAWIAAGLIAVAAAAIGYRRIR